MSLNDSAPEQSVRVSAPLDVEVGTAQSRRASRGGWWRVLGTLTLLLLFGALGGLWYVYTLNQAPQQFPVDEVIVIEEGAGIRDIARTLEAAGVVRSEWLLYLAIVLEHDPRAVKASAYRFAEPLTTRAVAARLTEGDFANELLRVTVIEGETVAMIANRVAEQLPNFRAEAFIALASTSEGYLFPDTYFVPPEYTEAELFALLRETHQAVLSEFAEALAASELTEAEVLTLASILEREANSPESKGMVAGILRNRLAIGMALQADATIEYVIETPLGELPPGVLAEELRERDSPYNTYKYRGLPPTPIGNPGRTAIAAALSPTESPYLYYITGDDGTFYYAETYAEHQRNIARYLR